MSFKYTENIQITIDGKKHLVKMEDGMTGIGSRGFWLNHVKEYRNLVIHSKDLAKGNHFLYTIKYGDCPWEKVDILIAEQLRSLPCLGGE